MLNYLALLSAVGLSVVSAYYSIIGLTALFPGDITSIVVMGVALECAKVIGATWLHHHWNIVSRFTRLYLAAGCIVLMIITSIGIFGFLSRSHIESTLKSTGTEFTDLTIIEGKMLAKKSTIADLQTQISQIDTAISKLSGTRQVDEIPKQRKDRAKILSDMNTAQTDLSKLIGEKGLLEAQTKKIEAEVGPLKYAANLVYGTASQDQLEKSVRFMIMMIIFAFDPMALCLIMAVTSNMHVSNRIKATGLLQKAELQKLRGRPPGSKNKTTETKRYHMVNKDNVAQIGDI